MENNTTKLVTLFHHENPVVLNFDQVWSTVGGFDLLLTNSDFLIAPEQVNCSSRVWKKLVFFHWFSDVQLSMAGGSYNFGIFWVYNLDPYWLSDGKQSWAENWAARRLWRGRSWNEPRNRAQLCDQKHSGAWILWCILYHTMIENSIFLTFPGALLRSPGKENSVLWKLLLSRCRGVVPGCSHADEELISLLVGRLAIDRFAHLPSTAVRSGRK